MTHRDIRPLFHDAVQACDYVAAFIAGRTLQDYEGDAMLRSAVERQLTVIGEALARAARVDPRVGEQVTELERIVAVRNRLVHGYSAIADDIVWSIATISVPALRSVIAPLLDPAG